MFFSFEFGERIDRLSLEHTPITYKLGLFGQHE